MDNLVKITTMTPLTWEYFGDAVNKLHREAIKYVKAGAQAQILENIYEDLTDEEKEIVRRGRNTQNHHLPKNANHTEYMYSTAFEGLIRISLLNKTRK